MNFHIDVNKVIESLEDKQESIKLTSSIDYDHINSKIYDAQLEILEAVIDALKAGKEEITVNEDNLPDFAPKLEEVERQPRRYIRDSEM